MHFDVNDNDRWIYVAYIPPVNKLEASCNDPQDMKQFRHIRPRKTTCRIHSSSMPLLNKLTNCPFADSAFSCVWNSGLHYLQVE